MEVSPQAYYINNNYNNKLVRVQNEEEISKITEHSPVYYIVNIDDGTSMLSLCAATNICENIRQYATQNGGHLGYAG